MFVRLLDCQIVRLSEFQYVPFSQLYWNEELRLAVCDQQLCCDNFALNANFQSTNMEEVLVPQNYKCLTLKKTIQKFSFQIRLNNYFPS